jgi:hypothetical protein
MFFIIPTATASRGTGDREEEASELRLAAQPSGASGLGGRRKETRADFRLIQIEIEDE